MRTIVLVIALSLVSQLALADGSPMKPGSYPHKAAIWKKFTVRDVSLGTEFYKASGFTCGPDPASRGFTTYRHTCVKFLDERCKGRSSKISHVRVAADVPAGQGCFMDEGSGGTYLDRKFMSPPLSSLSIVATDTSAPVIYEINYTFARDVVTDDSNLGKALLKKYGKPTNFDPPTRMMWTADDVSTQVSCGGTEGPSGDYCSLQVSDTGLLDSERSIQKQHDEVQQKHDAPAAPQL